MTFYASTSPNDLTFSSFNNYSYNQPSTTKSNNFERKNGLDPFAENLLHLYEDR